MRGRKCNEISWSEIVLSDLGVSPFIENRTRQSRIAKVLQGVVVRNEELFLDTKRLDCTSFINNF